MRFDTQHTRPSKKSSILLWTVQGLLAALFLFAGGMKLVTPTEQLAAMAPLLPVGFVKFIGVAEVLGALGLILPGLFKIRPVLTSVAATGLVIIMSGATTVTLETGPAAAAIVPAIVGVLLALIVYGRTSRDQLPANR